MATKTFDQLSQFALQTNDTNHDPDSASNLNHWGNHIPARASAMALRIFFKIANAWGLSPQEGMILLGVDSLDTYCELEKNLELAELDAKTLERLSHIFSIYKNLHILLPKRESANQWVKRPNTASPFQGKPALQRMLSGRIDDLHAVRKYLDAQVG